MFWIFVRIASVRFCDIQIVIITNFIVVASVGIKRTDCTKLLCDVKQT